jgi:hypothetical protein
MAAAGSRLACSSARAEEYRGTANEVVVVIKASPMPGQMMIAVTRISTCILGSPSCETPIQVQIGR